MKHISKVLLFCGLVFAIASDSFGACCQSAADGTRKINKASFFSSLAKLVDKVGKATVATPTTSEQDKTQKIEAIAAVLDFVGVVSGGQPETAKEVKKQTRSCDVAVSPELLESMLAVLRATLEVNSDRITAVARSSFEFAKTVQAADSTVLVPNKPKDSDKLVIALVTAIWKFVQEVMTQENISEYLSKQVTEVINYIFGQMVTNGMQEAQFELEQSPVAPNIT